MRHYFPRAGETPLHTLARLKNNRPRAAQRLHVHQPPTEHDAHRVPHSIVDNAETDCGGRPSSRHKHGEDAAAARRAALGASRRC